MKKILFIIMVLIMTINVCAAEVPEYMAELTRYGIIEGDVHGNLRLEDGITRAEMTKIVMASMCIGESLVRTDTVFEDVTKEYWASGYINAAYEMGIVNGKSKTSFDPEAEVTYEEAAKMLVCVLGYAQKAEEMGGYPFGYMQTASSCGVLEGLDVVALNSALRGDIACMVHNSLDIPLMYQVGFGSVVEFTIMNGENGTKLITLRTGLEEFYGEKEETPRYSGEEYVGRVLQITALKKTEAGYEFKNFLNETDDATYVVTEDTYVYLSQNTVKIEEIADGMYAQVWHRTDANGRIEILKIELMKYEPSGI